MWAFFFWYLQGLVAGEHYQDSTLFLSIGEKIQKFVRCKTQSLPSRALSGMVETTITYKSHG